MWQTLGDPLKAMELRRNQGQARVSHESIKSAEKAMENHDFHAAVHLFKAGGDFDRALECCFLADEIDLIPNILRHIHKVQRRDSAKFIEKANEAIKFLGITVHPDTFELQSQSTPVGSVCAIHNGAITGPL